MPRNRSAVFPVERYRIASGVFVPLDQASDTVASRLSGLGRLKFGIRSTDYRGFSSSVSRVVSSMYGALWLRPVRLRMDGVLGGDVVLMCLELGDISWWS